jgi:hypothetical protein
MDWPDDLFVFKKKQQISLGLYNNCVKFNICCFF